MWKLLGTITPQMRMSTELFRSLKSSLFISHHFQCTVNLNENVEKWVETLAEDKQKRVRHIQNEVSFKIIVCFCLNIDEIFVFFKIALRTAEGKKVPKLETINVNQFEEMLNLSNSRRHKYYDYLRAISIADSNEDVNIHVQVTRVDLPSNLCSVFMVSDKKINSSRNLFG